VFLSNRQAKKDEEKRAIGEKVYRWTYPLNSRLETGVHHSSHPFTCLLLSCHPHLYNGT
jgi:hypothetical protein